MFRRDNTCLYYIKRMEKVSWTSVDPTYTHFIINDKSAYDKCVRYVEEYRRNFNGCEHFLFEIHDKRSSGKWIKRFEPSKNFSDLPVVHITDQDDVKKLFCIKGVPSAM